MRNTIFLKLCQPTPTDNMPAPNRIGTKEVADANKISFGSDSKGYVYFIRNGNLHKIGITEDLVRRFKELAPDEILNVVRCENYDEVEKTLHARYKKVRLPQTEYFRLDDSQIAEVHKSLIELASF